MNILALDIASATGFAHNRDSAVEVGTWQLSSPSEVRRWGAERMTRRNDPRVGRLFSHLEPFRNWADVVIFEDVPFQTYTQQCQLWSSLRAAVWLAFDSPVTLMECVPVATLKRFATGHGGATKSMMMTAMVRKAPNRFAIHGVKNGDVETLKEIQTGRVVDDNAADAYHAWCWAFHNLSRIRK